MSAKSAEQNEAAIAQLGDELSSGLARLPQLVVRAFDGCLSKPERLVGLPAHLRTVINAELDRLEKLAGQLSSLEQIEHRRRESAV